MHEGQTTALATETFDRLELEPIMAEIYRYLSYPRGTSPPPRLASQTDEIIADGLSRLEPRGTYSLYAVTDQGPGLLSLGGTAIAGDVSSFLDPADRVAVFVVTVGSAISDASRAAARRGDSLRGWILDALGSWAAEATADALMGAIRRRLSSDDGLTPRFSPGYCGMELDEQRAIFKLADAEAVGVSLLSTLLMYPVKSVSGIVGVGPNQSVDSERYPCERCRKVGCHMRR